MSRSPLAPFIRDAAGFPFESFALRFYIVLLKKLMNETHFKSSEASHTFFKIKLKLCADVPKSPQMTSNNLQCEMDFHAEDNFQTK